MKLFESVCVFTICLLVTPVIGTPWFAQTKKDFTEKLGDTIVLPCRAENLTFGSDYVIWARINDDDSKTLLFNHGTRVDSKLKRFSVNKNTDLEAKTGDFPLKIENATREDTGRYKCFITTQIQAEVITVNVLAPPSTPVVRINKTSGLKEDDVISASCTTSGGNPEPEVMWSMNGNILPNTQRVSPGSVYGEVRLTAVLTLDRNFDGETIVCSAKNSETGNTPVTAAVPLSVQFKPSVTVEHSVYRVQKGKTATLRCIPIANPTVTSVRWQKDGVDIPGSSSHDLVLPTVTRANTGSYTCQANNPLGIGSAASSLDVLYAPEVKPQSPVSAKENTDVTIPCNVDANPPPHTVTWSRDGQNVGSAQADGSLKLESVSKKDAGNFVCRASNRMVATDGNAEEGYGQATTTLRVLYTPGAATISPTSPVNVKQPVTLTCSVADLGEPAGLIEWRREGDKAVLDVGSSVNFPYVSLANEGRYYCQARNEVGSGTRASVFLTVVEPPVWQEPVLPLTKTVQNGVSNPLVLECHVSAKPRPSIVWLRDGHELSANDLRMFEVSTNENSLTYGSFLVTSRLRFTGVERARETNLLPEDTGIYTCRVSSADDSYSPKEQTVNLIVAYKPVIASLLPTVATDMHKGVTVRCRAKGSPLPVITWESPDGQPLVNNTHVSFLNYKTSGTGANSDMFVIPSKTEHLGQYRCKAANNLGSTEGTVRLIIKSLPEAPTQLRVVPGSVTWGASKLEWNPGFNGGYLQYYVISVTESQRVREISLDDSSASFYNVTDLFPSQNYTFQVYARNALGAGPRSNTITASTLGYLLPRLAQLTYNPDQDSLSFPATNPSFCLRIEKQGDKGAWSVLHNCASVSDSSVAVSADKKDALRVSLCLVERPDVCGDPVTAKTVASDDLPTYLLAIIVSVCVVVVIVLVAVLVFLLLRRRRNAANKKSETKSHAIPSRSDQPRPQGIATSFSRLDLDDPVNGGIYGPGESSDYQPESASPPVIPIRVDRRGATSPDPTLSDSQRAYALENYLNDRALGDQDKHSGVPGGKLQLLSDSSSSQAFSQQDVGCQPTGSSVSSEESGYQTEPAKKKIFYEVVV